MLFFNFIDESEGIDNSEGQDVVSNTELRSKQCITCRYYYYVSKNFKYEKNICDDCYHCVIYENENSHLIFRIVTVKKGSFRTVSNYLFTEIEKILEEFEPNKKFGWIYKENLNEIKND